MLNVETEYYTLEMHLKTFQELPDYSAIYNNWCLDKKEISKALSAIPHFYPHFSDHDESHSQKIIRNIEMLLGTERIKALGPTTTWIILMVSYLHDTGMILVDNILSQKWSKKEFQDYISELRNASYDTYDEDYIQAANYIMNMNEEHTEDPTWPLKVRQSVILLASEYFRRSHPTYSRDALDKLEEYGLSISAFRTVPVRLKYMIGQISYLHGQPFEDVMELEYEANGVGIDKIHPRFIAELLRIGDLLDLDDGRFTQVYQKMISSMPVMSSTHKQKHASIRHFLINPKVIEITADCESPSVYRATQSWVDWIEDELKNFSINWSQVVPQSFPGGPPRLGETKLFLKGKTDLSQQANLRFEIKQENAFDIIEGSGIYDSKLVFLRELLQNAIDATKIQMWADLEAGRFDARLKEKGINNYREIKKITDVPLIVWDSYIIDVSVNSIGNNKMKIVVADRGSGIGINELQRLSNVGQSWKSSKAKWTLIQNMPDWLKPTGTFGIGLQSVFLATDEAIIYTKADGEIGKKATLVSRKKNGYITVEEEFLQVRGTRVELEVQSDLFRSNMFEDDFFINNSKSTQKDCEYVIRSMKEYLKNCFYDIRMFINDENVGEISKYNFLQEKLLEEFIDMEDFMYDLSFDINTGNIEINLLDKNSGNYFKLFGKNEEYEYTAFHKASNLDILFKGVEVNKYGKIDLKLNYLSMEIDLLSDQTKNCLNLARSAIKQGFMHEFEENINNYADISIRLVFEYLTENKIKFIEFAEKVNEIAEKSEGNWETMIISKLVPVANLILSGLESDLKIDMDLIRLFVLPFQNITMFNNEINTISPINVFRDNYIILIQPYPLKHFSLMERKYQTEKIIELLKCCKKLNEIIGSLNVIIDLGFNISYLYNKFQKIEELIYGDFSLSKIKRTNKSEEFELFNINGQLNIYLNQLVSSDFFERATIPPLEKYKDLIVKKLPRDSNPHFFSAYIISPFIFYEYEIELIYGSINSYEKLYQLTEERMGLDALVDWVEKYSIHDPVPTKQKIEESYQQLIKDHYDNNISHNSESFD